MKWVDKLNENIKKTVRSWLNVMPATSYTFQINEMLDFEGHAIRNRIWYRGDGNELEQFYGQNREYADKHKFWASNSTKGMEIRKIHTGLPGLIVRTLASVVLPDMNEFEFESPDQEQIWKEIEEDNNFRKKMESALKEALYIGDGAFKVVIDTEISDYPILEWYPGDRVEFVYQRDRIREIVFKTPYKEKGKTYVLNERYGYGYLLNELYLDNKLVDIKTIKATENLTDITFDDTVILAVPLMIYESSKYEGRGGSIFDSKLDSFDSLDETWSQWMDALRAGRAKTYVPDCLVPHDPNTGETISPNPFDNRYFAADSDMREGQKNQIMTDQPAIPHESYLASYVTALDLCLQGVISPSTLGIDVKKLDNAEAQREKEKTTLYTRNAIIETLQVSPKWIRSITSRNSPIWKPRRSRKRNSNMPQGRRRNSKEWQISLWIQRISRSIRQSKKSGTGRKRLLRFRHPHKTAEVPQNLKLQICICDKIFWKNNWKAQKKLRKHLHRKYILI